MAIGAFAGAARGIVRLYGEGTATGLSESQLLDRFLARRDENAFAALVERHGPMVRAVCRRVLRDDHATDDAFQATFLVLVRKARTVRGRDSLGPWLHRVAFRVAMRASQRESRRKAKEVSAPEAVSRAQSSPDTMGREARRLIHEVLESLPEKLRAPVVLCDLEGRTHAEAALSLDWPIGSVKGRLSRARELLRDRLARRGLTASVGVIAVCLTRDARASVSSPLKDATIAAASRLAASKTTALVSGTIPAAAVALAEEFLRASLMHKLRFGGAASAVLLLGLFAGGAAVVARQDTGKPAEKPVDPARTAVADEPLTGDLLKFQGTWKRLMVLTQGEQRTGSVPPVTLQKIDIRGRKLFGFDIKGEPTAPRSLKLDESVLPKKFEWRRTTSRGEEEIIRGIYRFEDHQLSFCYDPQAPLNPPSDFNHSSNDRGIVSIYVRTNPSHIMADEDLAELNRLQGNWRLMTVEREGESAGNPAEHRYRIFRADHSQEVDLTGDLRAFKALLRVQLDTSKSPKRMDLVPFPEDSRKIRESGGDEDVEAPVIHSIYKLEDGTLTTCSWSEKLNNPAMDFITRPGDDRTLRIYRREPQIPESTEAEKAELAKLSGNWARENTPSETGRDQFNLLVRRDTLMVVAPGKSPISSRTIRLDLSRTPHVMTLYEMVTNPLQLKEQDATKLYKVRRAAYKRDGDTLTLCINAPGHEENAPTELDDKPGSGRTLTVYHRIPTPFVAAEEAPPAEPEPKAVAAPVTPAANPSPNVAETSTRDALGSEVDKANAKLDDLLGSVGLAEIEVETLKDELRKLAKLASDVDDSLKFGVTANPLLQGNSREALEKLREQITASSRLTQSLFARQNLTLTRNKREIATLERQILDLEARRNTIPARNGKPNTIQVGDRLQVEVLEALPGRPITGMRVVRPDGTISLDFYGDLPVVGLTRVEIKVKLIEHLQKVLTDEGLGLIGEKPDGKKYPIPPAESDRVFVDDSFQYLPTTSDTGDLEQRLERLLKKIEQSQPLPGTIRSK